MRRITQAGIAGVLLLALGCAASPSLEDPGGAMTGVSDGDPAGGAMLIAADAGDPEAPQGKPPEKSDEEKSEKPKVKRPPRRGEAKPAKPAEEKPKKPGEEKPKPPDAKKQDKPDVKKTPARPDLAPKTPSRPPVRKAPVGPKQAMDEYSKEQKILEEERRALARSHIETGKNFMEDLDWEAAEREFKKAYDLDPSNEEAQTLYFRAQAVLDKREGQMGTAIRSFSDQQKVRRKQIAVEIRRIFAEGDAFYDDREYDRAIEKYEQVEAILAVDSADIPGSDALAKNVRERIAGSKRAQKEEEIANRRRLSKKAVESAWKEEDRRRRAERDKVAFLLDLAIEHLSAHRYAKAIRLLDDVLEIDPENRLAVQLRGGAVEGSFLHSEWVALRETDEQKLRASEEIDEAGIPYTDFVRFPKKQKWLDEVAKRVEGTGAAFAEENPEVRRMREILNTRRVSVNFEETPLEDVVDFLSDVTALNIQISPEVDTDLPVTLSLNEALLANALKLIMDKVSLTYTFRDDVIYIAQEGEEEGELIFEIYNVQDILNKIEDFAGPEIKVHSADAPQPGQGGGGQLVFDDDDDSDLEGTIDPDKLLDLIQSSTGEENWERENVSIEHHRGQLLINNTREVHLEIQKVLENLRKDAGLFVVVEARFVDLFDDFLSEVGIDYRGLPTAPLGNSTGVLAPNQTGGTDTGAERTRGTATDNVIGRLQNIFDGFTGFLTGSRLTGGTLPGRNMPGLSIQTTFVEPFQVNAILRARDEKSRIQLLSAPIITAANRQRVYISAITQRAYIADYELASGGTGFVAVEIADPIIQTFEEGVILDVRPTISSDRRFITLDAKPTLASLVGGFISTILVDLGSINQAAQQVPIGIPEITLQEAYTSVTIPDGGTALMGGFRSLNEQKLRSSIPVLESIPIFNVLGTRTGEISEKRSLVILITARVMVLRDLEKSLFSTG